ncbi:hypothetical protein GTS_00330 [Gandjariella thermophila]|uniref:Uncharacterized protein n=1 Tax=Gandjariella thermophila TaxID=1931992 RepID=A0A4D4IZR9_9PSEU|nr:hypothetical protein GTS_00330 [Gandjariella thermophila]
MDPPTAAAPRAGRDRADTGGAMPATVVDRMATTPTLPRPRGPLSEWVIAVLRRRPAVEATTCP